MEIVELKTVEDTIQFLSQIPMGDCIRQLGHLICRCPHCSKLDSPDQLEATKCEACGQVYWVSCKR